MGRKVYTNFERKEKSKNKRFCYTVKKSKINHKNRLN